MTHESIHRRARDRLHIGVLAQSVNERSAEEVSLTEFAYLIALHSSCKQSFLAKLIPSRAQAREDI